MGDVLLYCYFCNYYIGPNIAGRYYCTVVRLCIHLRSVGAPLEMREMATKDKSAAPDSCNKINETTSVVTNLLENLLIQITKQCPTKGGNKIFILFSRYALLLRLG